MTVPVVQQQEQELLQEQEQEQAREQLSSPYYCPVFSVATRSLTRCKRDNCAWWDSGADQCCLLSMAHSLRGIPEDLDSFKQKPEGR